MNDEYVEYFPVVGSTPEEIMESFKNIINEKLAVAEPAYSKRWEAMLERGIHQYWLEEIGNVFFVVVQWKVTSYLPREKFLGLDED